MHDRADGGIACADAFDEFDGALGVDRAFHINAKKIVVGGGAFDNGQDQAFAEFDAEVEAKLRQLAGDVGVEIFLGDAFEDFEIGIAGALGVGGGGDIFAEVVEADEHAGVVALAGGGDGFVESFAGDETVRHAAWSSHWK